MTVKPSRSPIWPSRRSGAAWLAATVGLDATIERVTGAAETAGAGTVAAVAITALAATRACSAARVSVRSCSAVSSSISLCSAMRVVTTSWKSSSALLTSCCISLNRNLYPSALALHQVSFERISLATASAAILALVSLVSTASCRLASVRLFLAAPIKSGRGFTSSLTGLISDSSAMISHGRGSASSVLGSEASDT